MGPVSQIEGAEQASRSGVGDAMAERGARWPAVVLLSVLPLVLTVGWLLLARWDSISDGTVIGRTAAGWANGSVVVDEVFSSSSALRVGDRVTAIDGVPFLELAANPGTLRPHPGQRLSYTVVRPGPAGAAGRVLDVPVTLGRYPLGQGLRAHLSVFPLVLTLYLVATFVVASRPKQQAARALYALGVLLPLTVTQFPLDLQVIELATGRLWPFVAGEALTCVLWGALLHFALVFPEPSAFVAARRWTVGVAYLLPFGYYLAQLPFLLMGPSDAVVRLRALSWLSQPAAHVQPVLVAAAMVANYRLAGDYLARRRMSWALLAFAGAAVGYLALGQIPSRVLGHPLIPWDWQVLLFAPFPVALGLAVLRYSLFDIQIILRRSLVFGALTATLVALYLPVVAVAGRLSWLPQGAAPFVASLAVALLFGPLRTRARRIVSRSLFGDRDDPYEVMNRLSQRLEATATADSVLTTLVQTLAETLRLSYAAIWLRDATDRVAYSGTRSGQSVRIPIVHAGEVVGELEIDAGPGREPFGVADQRLLDGLARHLGVISQNLLLEIRLRQSLERVVTAREEERRRLRRDLHDGLGPSLAAAGLQMSLAASVVERDPERARTILTGLSAAHRESVTGLRRLVDGLRPPVLDRLGLVGAVTESAAGFQGGASGAGAPAGNAVTIDVDAADGVEPLPAAVEVAAYRIVLEALTNVVRHSGASHCHVRLWRDDAALLVNIRDDGRGLAAGYRAGVGLTAIRERATELGGSSSVNPGPGGGTVVLARLPVRSA